MSSEKRDGWGGAAIATWGWRLVAVGGGGWCGGGWGCMRGASGQGVGKRGGAAQKKIYFCFFFWV